MIINLDEQYEFNRILLKIKIDLTDCRFHGKWVRIIQSENSVHEFFIHKPAVFSLSFESRLSYREYNDGYVKLSVAIANVPLSENLFFCESFGAVDDKLIKEVCVSFLEFNHSQKFLQIEMAKKYFSGLGDYDANVARVRDLIVHALNSCKPFSLVRLGDGEGRLIGFPDIFSLYEIVEECIGYQFGPKIFGLLADVYKDEGIYCGALVLKNLIEEAARYADVICVPDSSRFCEILDGNNFNSQVASSVPIVYSKTKLRRDFSPDVFLFYRFYELGYFEELFSSAEFISVISHTNPSEVFKKRFGVIIDEHISIPGHQTFMASEVPQFPFFYKNLVEKIEIRGGSHLFLVSAGYLAKHYCNVIKQLGGIAIDIGSIFDAWMGQGRTEAVEMVEYRI